MITRPTVEEQRNKRKGRTISFVIHALLLLILFIYTFPITEKKEVYPPPVTVEFDFRESSLSSYARAEEGKKREKNESQTRVKEQETQKVETKQTEVEIKRKPTVDVKKPTPVIKTKPTDPIVSDATVDDSPVSVIEEEIEISTDQEVLTEEDLAELEEEAEVPTETTGGSKGETTSSSDSGSGSSSPNILDGSKGGTGKGSKGDGPGASSGNDNDEGMGDGGAGTGMYDGSGDGVFGRKVIIRNWRGIFDGTDQSSGRIVMKVCINRAGDVTYTEILDAETEETDPARLKKVLMAMQGYKYEPDPTAPPEQCGKYTFNLDINALQGM